MYLKKVFLRLLKVAFKTILVGRIHIIFMPRVEWNQNFIVAVSASHSFGVLYLWLWKTHLSLITYTLDHNCLWRSSSIHISEMIITKGRGKEGSEDNKSIRSGGSYEMMLRCARKNVSRNNYYRVRLEIEQKKIWFPDEQTCNVPSSKLRFTL